MPPDIFGSALGYEPGNTVFQGGAAGTVCSLYFSLPIPTNLAEVVVWVVNDRGMSHFALKLLDSANTVINTITEMDIHFPYTDPVARVRLDNLNFAIYFLRSEAKVVASSQRFWELI